MPAITMAPPRTPPTIAPKFSLRFLGGAAVGVGADELVEVLEGPAAPVKGRE